MFSPWAKSCYGSILVRDASAPPGNSARGKAAANTMSRADCADVSGSAAVTLVTALVRDEVGLLLEDLILQGGVDASFIRWREFRMALGSTSATASTSPSADSASGARSRCSDRGHTAASQLRKGEMDWDTPLWQAGRALVPHGRHLCRALRFDP